jgi:hypothetical protein
MILTRPIARPVLILFALGAMIAALAVRPDAAQAADCGARTLVTPFTEFGDSNSYFLAPSGSFESGTQGWSLAGSSVVTGEDPFDLLGGLDTKSLRVASTATKSPSFCITRDDPHVRFAARSVKNYGASNNSTSLQVTAVLRSANGGSTSYYLGALAPQSDSSWFVSPSLAWGSVFADWLFVNGTATLELQFSLQGSGGSWYVDDIFVDPFIGR